MNKQMNRPAVAGLIVCCLLLCQAGAVLAQGYKGFQVGRYEGQVYNKTGGHTGKGTLEIRQIGTNGTVQAHLRDSNGLEGEGTLAGNINTNGVMQLSGIMISPTNGSRWQSALIAVINNGQLRMGNTLTLGNTVEEETATMAFTPTTTPVRVNTTQPMNALTGIGAAYGARNPRTCANTKAPASGPISVQQAIQYFICGREHEESNYLYLVDQVQIQVGKGRPYLPNTDRMSDADLDSPVYPIQGSFMKYQIERLSELFPNNGKNCTSYANRNASGKCYRTSFGDWKCQMDDLSNNVADRRYDLAPPQ